MPSLDFTGKFYLGRLAQPPYGRGDPAPTTEPPYLYDPADLTTHAVIVGMTGSGKTGLCLALLEEAALHGYPALLIDPKGDIANLLLQFPDLSPADFQPWIDPDAARRAGQTVEEAAAETAARWRSGLAEWNLGSDSLRALREAADFTLYTPGSSAGRPLSILASLKAPHGRPGGSPHGRPGGSPLPWEAQRERFALALRLNNILAAPAFQSWISGDPLDVQSLLYTPQGGPRHAVIYIAHLTDAERMFIVTLLLSALETWMRTQPGAAGLRALCYMDEIFGYLPPVGVPPSKEVLLRLLKTGRAFGLGLLLATQNPVDLDYKALSNAGTWFVGKLQTEQDRSRLLDGLAARLDRAAADRLISTLDRRLFLAHNVHSPTPALFRTRWTMCYLAGPLTRTQLRPLAAPPPPPPP
ncbi:MAG: ATP-binding protein, partial [Chloroflexi bacterium]|nr:ATP-binding protein [Chloroflexota bacterium]